MWWLPPPLPLNSLPSAGSLKGVWSVWAGEERPPRASFVGKGPPLGLYLALPRSCTAAPAGAGLRKPALRASCPLWGVVGVQAAGTPILSTPAGPGSGLGWGEEALLTPGAQPGRTWPPSVGEARAASLAVTERSL